MGVAISKADGIKALLVRPRLFIASCIESQSEAGTKMLGLSRGVC